MPRPRLDLAFPNHKHLPAHPAQCELMLAIPFNIAFQLLPPIVPVGFRNVAGRATRMLVPETPMYENDLPPAWKNQIGGTRQISTMEPEAITYRMGQPAHGHLRLGSLGANAGHDLTSALGANGVNHFNGSAEGLDRRASRWDKRADPTEGKSQDLGSPVYFLTQSA